MSPSRSVDPRTFLPLTPLAFEVLLSLVDRPRHGYAIIQDVLSRTDGVVVLRTGTLYTLLQRLLDERLIEETNDRPAPEADDERRRYYTVTRSGREVMRAEARRLEQVLATVRRKHVLGRSRA